LDDGRQIENSMITNLNDVGRHQNCSWQALSQPDPGSKGE